MEPHSRATHEPTGPSSGSRFQVTIWYREPTYELVVGPKPEPYFCTYVVTALDSEHASRLAMREFDELARLSSVGWVRHVVRIEACEQRKTA